MGEPRKRLDGWKSIAAHFNRNRTTVIRWATDDGLPVQRVSGKAGASVWAWADELDAWLDRQASLGRAEEAQKTLTDASDAPPAQSQAPAIPVDDVAFIASPRKRAYRSIAYVAILGFALLTVCAIFVIAQPPQTSGSAVKSPLPADPAVAEIYLRARDEWAARTPDGLNRALSDFSNVMMREPSYTPAYTGLADTYILECEYASMPDSVAYPKAEAAARAALGIDPNSAGARRALGLIAYWYRRDFPTAQRLFLEALRAAPNDAQTHFWFGNVLFDDGRTEAGLQELRQARLLDPGSRAIETVYAWFQWIQGPDDAGIHDLEEVSQQAPNHSEALKYLAYISLVRGDYPQYLANMARFATLQGKRPLQLEVAAEAEAFRRGGERPLLAVLARRPWSTDAPYWIPLWRTTAISLLGSRSEFLAVLRTERQPGLWRGWRWSQARLSRWRNDEEVATAFRVAFAKTGPS
jgi:tetratricopeptide (TPR) repeat protein